MLHGVVVTNVVMQI